MVLVRSIPLWWRRSHPAIQEQAVVATPGLGYDAEDRVPVCGNKTKVFR